MNAEQDARSWVDTLARLLPGIGAVIAGIFIPLVINHNAESNRNHQLYVDIISKREVADSELRAKMFENLIASFFGDISKGKSDNERLTKLRLIALNFHENFDFKPLFESLESEFLEEEKVLKLEQLRDIAREIVGKQEALLSQVKEGRVFSKIIKEGAENGVVIPPNCPPDSQAAYMGHRLGIILTKIATDERSVHIKLLDFPEKETEVAENIEVEFNVSHFDLPFIDNTKLFNGTRFAFTFKGVVIDSSDGERAAALKIMFFPESYMSSRDRPFLDEMLEYLKAASRNENE